MIPLSGKYQDMAAASVLLLCLLFIPEMLNAAIEPAAHTVSILYIESNTGDSSGGHAAVKIGDDVFHFQHGEEGLLLLHRDKWDPFRFYYNDLGNRTMYQAGLSLPPGAAEKVHECFIRLLIEQEGRLSTLHNLRQDQSLLNAFKNGDEPGGIKGAGFFLHGNNSGGHAADILRQEIAQRFGAEFLSATRDELAQKLSHLPDAGPDQAFTLTPYREQLELFEAVSVLEARRGVNPAALISVPCGHGNVKTCRLTPRETESLKQWAAFFKKSVFTLLESRRPDRGFPLMLATARFLAVQRSIEHGVLFVLDSFPVDAATVNPVLEAGSRKTLEEVSDRARKRLDEQRVRLFSKKNIDEARWCGFENMASRWSEFMACVHGKERMRVYSGISVPNRPGIVELPSPPPQFKVKVMLETVSRSFSISLSEFQQDTGYNLINRNCVTELFRVISDALSGEQCHDGIPCLSPEQKEAMDSMSFIPWRMFQQVSDTLPTKDIICYPSWRQRQLSSMYSKEDPVTVYLRECNTITSSIYQDGRQDSAFLLFTEEHIIPRPLFGAINIAWSLPRTCLGLITWPVDSGYMLKSGAMGTLFSLPELLFVNIRKGSFSFIQHREN